MTEYVVLIVGDADRWWTTMDAEQRAAGYAEYTRFGEELSRARPHQVTGGAELHATSRGQAHPGVAGAPSPTGRSPRSPSRSAASTRCETDDLDDLARLLPDHRGARRRASRCAARCQPEDRA